MKKLKIYFLEIWKLFVSFTMGIGGELVFYPFGGAGENFVNEVGLVAIPFNVFYFVATYYILSDVFYIEDEKNENDKIRVYARK